MMFSYIKVGDSSEPDGCDVEGVCDEVHDVPHVADVLLEAHVPQLLDLRPDETGHLQYSTVQYSTVQYTVVQYSTNPGEDAALDQRGRGAALGCAGGRVVPAQHVLDPLRGQDQQDCN